MFFKIRRGLIHNSGKFLRLANKHYGAPSANLTLTFPDGTVNPTTNTASAHRYSVEKSSMNNSNGVTHHLIDAMQMERMRSMAEHLQPSKMAAFGEVAQITPPQGTKSEQQPYGEYSTGDFANVPSRPINSYVNVPKTRNVLCHDVTAVHKSGARGLHTFIAPRTVQTHQRRGMGGSSEEGCDDEKKPCKNARGCPQFQLEGCCANRKPTYCERPPAHTFCQKQECPYPSYSESCGVAPEYEMSECRMCPWKKQTNPNMPDKLSYKKYKKFHTLCSAQSAFEPKYELYRHNTTGMPCMCQLCRPFHTTVVSLEDTTGKCPCSQKKREKAGPPYPNPCNRVPEDKTKTCPTESLFKKVRKNPCASENRCKK